MSRLPAILLLFLCATCFGWSLKSTALAQTEAGPSRTMSLRDAIALTLYQSPRLQGHRFALSAVAAKRDQAALRPPLTAGIEIENVLGTNRLSALDDTETTLSLGTILERAGKRERRIDVAERERDLVANAQDAERLDLLSDVSRRFFALLKAQEELKALQRTQDIAERIREAVRRRAAIGAGSATKQTNADLQVLAAARETTRAEAAIDGAGAALGASWGAGGGPSFRAVGDIFTMIPVGNFEALAAGLERNPAVVRFSTQRRLQEATLRLAEAGRTPDITVSAGLRHLQAERSQALMLSASIPLQSGSRSRPFEQESQNRLSAVAYEEAATRNELTGVL